MASESIIAVIQQMVQEGQPREKIVATLHDLGVNDEQAKKLLLIAEADTFTLLKKEINAMVRDEFETNKKDFENQIHKELVTLEEKEKTKVKEIASESLKSVVSDVKEEARAYQGEINKTVETSQKTVSLVKYALDSINTKISQMELDIEQLKVHKFRKRSMAFSYLMLLLGAILFGVALYMFYTKFTELDISQMLLLIVIVLASITLMFASIIA